MVRPWASLTLPLLLIVACAGTDPVADQEPEGCSDFLEVMGFKPDTLTFRGCRVGNVAQLRALRADYETRGTDAKAVEQSLIDNVNMTPLRFSCCGWETRPVSFGFDNEHYEVHMSSIETIEQDWNNITTFRVHIYKLLESP